MTTPSAPKIAPAGKLTTKEKLYHLFGASNLGLTLESRQIVDLVLATFPGTNRTSVIPSDFCYNIVNAGINFQHHLFEKRPEGKYKVLGEGYPYVGPITWKGEHVGDWESGSRTPKLFKNIAK